MKVIIVGSFSGNNYGDIIVLESILVILKQQYGVTEEDIIIPTSNKLFIKKKYPGIKCISITIKESFGLRLLNPKLLFELKNVNYIFTTAGILFDYKFWNYRFNYLPTLLPLLSISSFLGIKIIGLNVGISPSSFPTGSFVNNYYKRTLKLHDWIIVRDKGSLKQALSLDYEEDKLIPSVDIALFLLTNQPRNKEKNKKIFVNLSRFAFKNFGLNQNHFDLNFFLKSLVNLSESREIVLFSTEKHDSFFMKELKLNWLPNSTYQDLSNVNPEKLYTVFEDCLFAITTRMHACIITTNLRIPTLAVRYHPKVDYYMNSLSLGNFLIQNSSDLEEKIGMILQKTGEVQKEITESIDLVQEDIRVRLTRDLKKVL